MARISRRKIDNKLMDRIFELFFEIVGRKSSKNEFLNVIADLLSSTERVMIVKRVAIIYLLMKNYNQRDISHILKVSNATVSKFSVMMEREMNIISPMKAIIRNEKFSQYLDDFFDIIRGPGVPGTNWSAGWQRRKEKLRKQKYGL